MNQAVETDKISSVTDCCKASDERWLIGNIFMTGFMCSPCGFLQPFNGHLNPVYSCWYPLVCCASTLAIHQQYATSHKQHARWQQLPAFYCPFGCCTGRFFISVNFFLLFLLSIWSHVNADVLINLRFSDFKSMNDTDIFLRTAKITTHLYYNKWDQFLWLEHVNFLYFNGEYWRLCVL